MLKLEDIFVKYSYKSVLNGISLQFEKGKIYSLLGENGAGKSTLAHVICGDINQTSGKIFLNDKEIYFDSPKKAIEHGICCVHQRPLLAQEISIYENLKIGVKKIDKQKQAELLNFWLPGISAKTKVKELGIENQFYVSLVGALLKNPEILILDEPPKIEKEKLKALAEGDDFTTAGNESTTEKSFAARENVCTAREDEFTTVKAFAACENACTAPNNESTTAHAFTAGKNKFSNEQASVARVNSITPRGVQNAASQKSSPRIIIVITHDLNEAIEKTDHTILLQEGKVLKSCPTSQTSAEEIENLLFGISEHVEFPPHLIQAELDENTFFMRKNRKIAYIPSNKTFRASNPNLTIKQLLCSKRTWLKNSDAIEFSKLLLRRADVNIKLNEKVSALSGGMLQRLILEKELAEHPQTIVLFNPLHGLDIDATKKLYAKLEKLAQSGVKVIIKAEK